MASKTKAMVEGAIIASMYGVLALLNSYSASTFDLFILYGMVIPIVWYSYHYHLKESLVVVLVAMLLILICGVPFFTFSAFFSCVEGIYIGECIKRNKAPWMITLGVIILAVINNVMVYQVISSFLGVDLVKEMTVMYESISLYLPNEITLNQLLSLIPLVIVLTSLLEGYLILLICEVVLHRLHIPNRLRVHISYLHVSKTYGLLSLMAVLVGSYGYYTSNIVFYEYMMIIGMLVFVVDGLSFMINTCVIKGKPKLTLPVVIGVFIPMVIYVYIFIGLIDIFYDLRGKLWGVN